MAESSAANTNASEGPAVEAMTALIQNEPMRKLIVDHICKGKETVEKSDLIKAIRMGCDFWITNPTVEKISIFEPTRNNVKAWHDANGSDIDAHSDKYLQECFRDLCTTTETMLEKASNFVGKQHLQELLHGRKVQNRPTVYQLENKVLFGDKSPAKLPDCHQGHT